MTDATFSGATSSQAQTARASGTRDIRLDFYRGLSMFIILIAHIPNNFFALWIPARFGYSDATEIFVFCSGMASAIAFGRVFQMRGWHMGTARVAFRVWQVYWAHVGLFLATTALLIWLTGLQITHRDYVGQLNLWPFLTDTQHWQARDNLVGLLTLTYVPNYFDILPMYLVVLAMMPVLMALSRISPWLSIVSVLVSWAGAQSGVLWLPAEPWTAREWFFNPFGWQLVFFTGFALMLGWLPKPPVTPILIALSLAILLASVPGAYFRVYQSSEWAMQHRGLLEPWFQKTDFGPLRYIHFLALAYLAWVVAGEGGARLQASGGGILAMIWRGLLSQILKVGQQSLAVFVVSMFLAQLLGFILDVAGRSTLNVWAINLGGFACLILTAHIAGWFKTHPWRTRHAK